MKQFYAYCSRDLRTGDSQIYLRKFTFDKKTYFVVPDKFKKLDDHPLIKSAKNANFSKLVNSKSNGFRHIALNLTDENGQPSKESVKYIKDGKFFLDSFLEEEDSNGNSNKTRGILAKQLSFDTDEEEEPIPLKKSKLSNLFVNDSLYSFDSKNGLNSLENLDNQFLSFVKKYGKYSMFRKELVNNQYRILSPEKYMNDIETDLIKGFDNPRSVIDHFFSFISDDLFEWYFSLKDEEKSTFAAFRLSFINQVKKLEYDNYRLSTMNMPDLANDIDIKNSIWNFIKNKTGLLQKIYPNILFNDIIKMVISSVHDLDVFRKLESLDFNPEAIKFVAQKIDRENENNAQREMNSDESSVSESTNHFEIKLKENNILIEELKLENNSVKKELTKANKIIDELKSKNNNLQSSLDKAIEEKEECESAIEDLNNQIQRLNLEVNSYKGIIKEVGSKKVTN